MAAIRSKDTKPEVLFRKLLFSAGYRYRLNTKRVYGHPDLWLAKYNTAIFVHGCFWHRHQGCKYSYHPKSRQDYWEPKFTRNILRDIEVREHLREDGIRQLVIWECVIRKMKNAKKREEVKNRVCEFLISEMQYVEIGD